jgi:hypothetical protein
MRKQIDRNAPADIREFLELVTPKPPVKQNPMNKQRHRSAATLYVTDIP